MIRPFKDKTPVLGARVYVDGAAQLIGAVSLGDDSSLWPMTVARGDVNTIEIGERSNIQDCTVLHVTHDGPYTPGGVALVIGNDVTIGHRVILHACTVGDRCLVGMGSIVMDGAILEDEVMLAAGSLVSPGKRLESGWLYRGSPAVKVRELSAQEVRQLEYSAQHYVKLKDQYLGFGPRVQA